MKERFIDVPRFTGKSNALLRNIIRIVEEYQRMGYKLTLRQLYYQLVSRDIIPNIQSEYAKISGLLVKARMSGLVDWESIEDRIRVPNLPYYANSIEDAMSDILRSYRLDRMENQDVYIEVWVEKDALSGVLKRVTHKYHIRLMVNRGYSSCTAMHDAYNRFPNHKDCHILYLGDHDPSGEDMVRDIRDRLNDDFSMEVDVTKIALTYEQIQQYNPPPNPTKLTDTRAAEYIKKYGNTSWEVDALRPEILNNLVESAILSLIDQERFHDKLIKEEEDKEEMGEFIRQRNQN